jgi:hypothetical protein
MCLPSLLLAMLSTGLGAEQPTAIYQCLVRRAEQISSQSIYELPPLETWKARLPAKRKQWLEMLGLDPLPPRTDLHMTITGTLDRGDYLVDKLHFQPLPGCRIAANLYRPKHPQGRLPGVVYVCGHSPRGKFHYQPHPRWFGQHGYVAIVLDPIQVGENGGFHHGVYRNQWWHWFSQGYSPAGVEVWAAMRAFDYLASRPDVDPERFGITGLSGGGTMSWFTGAADERIKVVVPACQTGTMYQHVRDRTIDGHCDCTYWVNVYGWDFPDVASLIAPRALLVAASTEDVLFRPYAFRDLVHRARMVYRLFDCEERVGLVEDVFRHGYTPKTRLAIFSWFDKNLKGSDVPVTEDIRTDDEKDETLAVYPGKKPPADDRLKDVDKFFLRLPGLPEVKDRAGWELHQREALAKLRATTFRGMPRDFDVADFTTRRQGQSASMAYRSFDFESEPGLPIRAELGIPLEGKKPYPLVVAPLQPDARSTFCCQGTGISGLMPDWGMAAVAVRATGDGSIGPGLEWTIRRAYPILGQSLPERQTFDLLRGIALLRRQPNVCRTIVFGKGPSAALAIYAALLDPQIEEIVLDEPVTTHWDAGPEFLAVLKVGDLPHNLALVFPRRITFVRAIPEAYQWTRRCYEKCGAADRVRVVRSLREL